MRRFTQLKIEIYKLKRQTYRLIVMSKMYKVSARSYL